MKPRSVTTLVAVLATAILLFIVFRVREPMVNGQPVGYWIDPRGYKPGESRASVEAAYREMDQRSVRWLARELDWQPSRLREALAKRGVSMFGKSERTPGERRVWTAAALGNLGKRAAPAVPALKRAAQTTVDPDAWLVRAAAKAALIRLGEESMQAQIDALGDTSDRMKWYEEITILEWLGTNAAPAIRAAAAFVLSTNDAPLRSRAAGFLGAVGVSPEECVPVLRHALEEPATREMALRSLASFGAAASDATDAIVACLTDKKPYVRAAATQALRAVNPERAEALRKSLTR